MIKIGEQAPLDIIVSDTQGVPASLRNFLGSYIVLYAYPRDETPGCIKEACSIRDVYEEFKAIKVVVIGISPDDEESHKKFTEKHMLPFRLWADPRKELLGKLGVWGDQKLWGEKQMGVARTTFLIDPTGKIIHIWENVNPEGHGEEVLDFVTKAVSK